jgi:hypothetical protein
MSSWEQFATDQPEMAKVLRHLLGWIPIAYIATARKDGSPRLHPFCPIFASDGIYIAVRPTSPKRHDLRNDGRFAMHALPGKRDDEFYMTGRATLVEDADTRKAVVGGAGHTVHPDDDVFELHAEYVMTAHWENMGQPDTYPVRKEWRAGVGALAAPKKTPSNTTAKRANGAKPKARAASGSRATRKGS